LATQPMEVSESREQRAESRAECVKDQHTSNAWYEGGH